MQWPNMICHSDRHRRRDMFVNSVGNSAEAAVRFAKVEYGPKRIQGVLQHRFRFRKCIHLRFRRTIELHIDKSILSKHYMFRSADGTLTYTDLYSTTSIFLLFRILTTCPYLRPLIGTSCSIGGLPRPEYGARSISWKCANISGLYTL